MREPLIPLSGKLRPNTDYVPKRVPARNAITEEKTCKLMQSLKMGMSKANAAKHAGISPSTLERWLKKGESLEEEDGTGYYTLYNRIQRSVGECELEHLQVIKNAAIEEGSWQASAWILERRFKDWNKKSQVEHNSTLTLESLLSHGGQEESALSLKDNAVEVDYLDITNGETSGKTQGIPNSLHGEDNDRDQD